MRFFRDMRVSVLLALPVMLSALPVRAEEGGLPQLDTTLFPEQIFWLAISFSVLYVLMSKVALPRVARTQANRKSVIASELQAAHAANDTAKVTLAAVEKSLNEARAKAQVHVNEMMGDVANEASTRHATQEKEMLRRLHSAEADIAVTRQAALVAVRASAGDLASAVVEKILGSKQRGES
jgi:F-type H+-transporting ATPase subunit b